MQISKNLMFRSIMDQTIDPSLVLKAQNEISANSFPDRRLNWQLKISECIVRISNEWTKSYNRTKIRTELILWN